MIGFSSIFKMFDFHTECSGGSSSMTFVYNVHYFCHGKKPAMAIPQLTKSSDFHFSLYLALICVCMWFLKKPVVNILKIELVLIISFSSEGPVFVGCLW